MEKCCITLQYHNNMDKSLESPIQPKQLFDKSNLNKR